MKPETHPSAKQPRRLPDLPPLLVMGIIAAGAAWWLDGVTEERRVLNALREQGFRSMAVEGRRFHRSLFWISGSDWKVRADGGAALTFEKSKFDLDILEALPKGFGDHRPVTAAWRHDDSGKAFYLARAGEFVYVWVAHMD